jgi:hypothetical protein
MYGDLHVSSMNEHFLVAQTQPGGGYLCSLVVFGGYLVFYVGVAIGSVSEGVPV